MREVFNVPKSGGDDPIMCLNVENKQLAQLEDILEISTERINEGDVLVMANDEGELVNFEVVRVEEGKVWFKKRWFRLYVLYDSL